MDYILKVDDTGRIIIPKKVRDKYGMKCNDVLYLCMCDEGFTLRKEFLGCDLKVLIEKIRFLENKYNVKMILTDNERVIYETNGIYGIRDKQISKEISSLISDGKKIRVKSLKITNDVIIGQRLICSSIDLKGICGCLILFEDDLETELCDIIFDVLI